MSSRAQKHSSRLPESDFPDVRVPSGGQIVASDTWKIELGDGYTALVVVGDIGGAPAATSITLSSATRPVTATAWRWRLNLDSLDTASLLKFISVHYDSTDAPEPGTGW